MRIESLHDLHSSLPDIDGFWNHSDLIQTEFQIRSLLPPQDQAPTVAQVEALTQLARVYSLQGRRKEAQMVLSSIPALLASLGEAERSRPEIRYHLEEGRLSCLSMYPSKALESFIKAWNLAEKSGLSLFAIDAAYMFSITLPAKQGKKWLQTAMELAEKSLEGPERKWLSHLYMLEGWQAFDAHDFGKALVSFENAISNRDNLESDLKFRTLSWCRARTLRALGRAAEALKIQEDLLVEFERSGTLNGHVYLELAECHQALQQPLKAKAFYELALDLLKKDQWYADNHESELNQIKKKSKQ